MSCDLHEKALELAQEFKRVEAELMSVLREIDTEKYYRKLGYASLFEYATKGLGLTESVAYGFIAVARKSTEVPELKQAIEEGVLSVSQAKRVTSVMDQENAKELIGKARVLSQRELEKTVAELKPEAAITERARFVTVDRLELKLGVSEEVMKKLKRVQDLLSQKNRSSAKFEDALAEALECYLEKNDPVRRAERVEARKIVRAKIAVENSAEPSQETVLQERSVLKPSSSKVLRPTAKYVGVRKRISLRAAVKHQVRMRDRGQCTYVDEGGERCASERWVEIHHKIPVSHGGRDIPTNLMTLCSCHHKGIHASGTTD